MAEKLGGSDQPTSFSGSSGTRTTTHLDKPTVRQNCQVFRFDKLEILDTLRIIKNRVAPDFPFGGIEMAWNFHRRVIVGTAAALAAIAPPAYADRIQIDNSSNPIGAASLCTIGSACTALMMPFSANFGSGAFNSVYVYTNGLVSIGSQIAAGANLSSLASIGGNVFTAGYSPGGLVELSDFQVQDPTPQAFDATGSLFLKPVFRVRYFTNLTTDPANKQRMQFSIFEVGGGEYALQFGHGSGANVGPPVFASDGYLGFSFGGAGIERSGPALISDINGYSTKFEYFFGANAGAVPEPASWAMLVVGFGLMGGIVRRQSMKPKMA